MGYVQSTIRSDDAVSPIIGVILMVAVTVILAAVVAASTFGMAENVKKRNVVAVDVVQQGDDIILTIMGSYVEPTLQRLYVTGTAADGTPISGSFPNTPPDIGDTLPLTGAGNNGRDHVVVVAELGDSVQQVVLDVWI